MNEKDAKVIEDPNIDEIVEKLNQLSKIGTLRSCEEYAAFGIRTSGFFPIDPDGILIGQPAFNAFCRFDPNTGHVSIEVMHNLSEDLLNVENCDDPGCYIKNLTYFSGNDEKVIELSQLEALIALSSDCKQEFYYECTLAPLRNSDIDFAYWTGRNGEKNTYFTGSDPLVHVCDCFYSQEGCVEQDVLENSCNCDSNEPTPLVDTGTITKSSSLPMLSIAFGGLRYDIQKASYTIGRLSCHGKNTQDVGTSCKSLKLGGETKSGYYTIRNENSLHTSTVFCDMNLGGYDNIPEFKVLSSDAPLGTITAWTPKIDLTSNDNIDLPDGWLLCDGGIIDQGLWNGGRTPNLNSEGRFLRGGSIDEVLTMQDDSFQDHGHPVIDSGHTHTDNGHAHSYVDHYINYIHCLIFIGML